MSRQGLIEYVTGLLEGNAYQLPFQDQSFDGVISVAVSRLLSRLYSHLFESNWMYKK